MIALAHRLKIAREMAGLSPAQIAHMEGLSRDEIIAAEGGDYLFFDGMLERLMIRYDVNQDWLTGNDEALHLPPDLVAELDNMRNRADRDRLLELLISRRGE